MFNALLHRAQATVDKAIGQAVNRVIVAVPLVVAMGFATAALTERLTTMWGTELGYLAVAGLYAVVTLIAAAIVMTPREVVNTGANGEAETAAAAEATSEAGANADEAPMSDVDRELMTAALTSVAPVAAPALLRLVMRNLPILLALAAALFIMTRPQPSEGRSA